MNFIINKYKKAFSFSKQNIMKLFWICTGAFLILTVISYFVFEKMPHAAENMLHYFLEMIEEKGVLTADGNIDPVKLFLNNFQATFIAVFMGFIPFLFFQVWFVLATNAVIIGAVMQYSLANGMSGLVFLASLLPHGIFELPAVFFSVALSIHLCISLSKKIIGTEMDFKLVTIDVLWCYGLITIPLLAIAAVVETYLTPIIIKLVI